MVGLETLESTDTGNLRIMAALLVNDRFPQKIQELSTNPQSTETLYLVL